MSNHRQIQPALVTSLAPHTMAPPTDHRSSPHALQSATNSQCANIMAAATKMAATVFSTPVNTVTREALTVLIANNIMNSSVDFGSDTERMETDSPVRKPNMLPISKKLFHSPMNMNDCTNENYTYSQRASERTRKAKKRKQILIPDSGERIKKAYVTECDQDGYSPGDCAGMRKKVLISLFHNKEYSMELDV